MPHGKIKFRHSAVILNVRTGPQGSRWQTLSRIEDGGGAIRLSSAPSANSGLNCGEAEQGSIKAGVLVCLECSGWFPAWHQPPVGRLSVNQLCITRLALSAAKKKKNAAKTVRILHVGHHEKK